MPQLADRIERARNRIGDLKAVVLPDFFLDHFVRLADYGGFQRQAEGIHARGGGNLLTGPQSFRLGGNAANTVFALGRLGVPAALVTRTDRFGAAVIRETMDGLPVDTSCVTIGDRSSSTVALEFHEEGSNVMLSDPGPLRDLTLDDLDPDGGEDLWRHIGTADAVAVTNWSQTIEHGTQILQAVTARAHENDAFTFLDTGDPTHRGEDSRRLLLDGDALRHVDAWGMNENELLHFARHAEPGATGFAEAAQAIRSTFRGRLDVHTWEEVFSIDDGGLTRCGTYLLEPLRLTGSGDAWNAGNLLGQMLGLDTGERLCVANAVAALTITGPDGMPPDLDTLVHFLRHRPYQERRLG